MKNVCIGLLKYKFNLKEYCFVFVELKKNLMKKKQRSCCPDDIG